MIAAIKLQYFILSFNFHSLPNSKLFLFQTGSASLDMTVQAVRQKMRQVGLIVKLRYLE